MESPSLSTKLRDCGDMTLGDLFDVINVELGRRTAEAVGPALAELRETWTDLNARRPSAP